MQEITTHPDALLTTQAFSDVSVPEIQSIIPAAGPVDQPHRISALDSLRGFALLGILLLNIVGMGLYLTAYDNPSVTGGSTGANLWVWIVMHVLAEGKMRCLFSLVFGASVILLTSRLEKRSDGADIYYRRTLWLLVFGIAHAYVFWLGDILYPYALCGLALYPFRNMKARNLVIVGGALLVINAGIYVNGAIRHRDMIRDGIAAEQLANQGKKLTDSQQEAKRHYEHWKEESHPNAAALKKDAVEWQSHNPLRVLGARAKIVSEFVHSEPYYSPSNLDIWCMMFIGMGLLKLGVLNAKRSTKFYAVAAMIGYGIGIPLNSYTAWLIVQSHFDPATRGFSQSTYDLGRLTVALGHLALIMLLVNTGLLRWLTRCLAAVGQMALSNYVFDSVVTAFIFTGYGFSMYGKLQRYQLYYVVAALWVFQLIASPIWMRYFQFGPLEWCWRSLTYWRKQPMRRVAIA